MKRIDPAVSAAARALNQRRKVHSGGDTTVPVVCPFCGQTFGTNALRAHKPHCPQRPTRGRS